jgi:hypothetical protein
MNEPNRASFGPSQRYKIFNKEVNWEQANEFCESIDASLVTIPTQEVQDLVESQISEVREVDKQVILFLNGDEIICRDCFWLGAQKPANSEVFQWTDSNSVTFTNWHENSDYWDEEDKACVSIAEDGQGWSAMDCNIKSKFICERELGFEHFT